MSEPKAVINVAPLIDILLVLLIVFMIISPMKASKFEAKIPSEQKTPSPSESPPDTLIVKINSDTSLEINASKNFGTIASPEKLIDGLEKVFNTREETNMIASNGLSKEENSDVRIEKTVFIKAPRSIGYGKVVKVIDAVKIAGARPISLQIDDLD